MSVIHSLLRTAHRLRRPVIDGLLDVEGLHEPITIRRDGWHVPHIEAATTPDAWFGLGFCMGQDRSFQVELFNRIASGRLSEMVGSDAIPVDRFTRRLGFHRLAKVQYARLREDLRDVLDSFAAGINAGRQHSPRPLEFVLLRHRPEPIAGVDIAATLKLNGFLLSANWQTELARLLVLIEDGPEALAAVDVLDLEDIPVTSPPGDLARAAAGLADEIELLSWYVPTAGASNNWVIGGERTASGRPLVANDPHMPPMLPSPWYLAHLRTPDWEVAGAALAGAPAIAAGHNGHAAWGTTSGHADDSDLFFERLSPDRTQVRAGDGWEPLEQVTEVIGVKGADDVIERILVTPRGPVVSDSFDVDVDLDGTAAKSDTSVAALSLAFIGLATDGDVEGYLRAPEARSFEQLRRLFEHWPGMSLNVVYGDVDGHLGWQLVGELPVRRSGRGLVPLPGWDPGVGWEPAHLPFDQMPHLADPPSGWLATANNQPAGERDDLGVDFLDGYRVAAIAEAIEERDDWDVDRTFRLQRDTRSLPWREIQASVLATPVTDHHARRAIALLRDWDGNVAADSSAAAVFEVFLALMTRRIVEAKAPRAGEWLLGRSAVPQLLDHTLPGLVRASHTCRLIVAQPDDWFHRSWNDEIESALRDAVVAIEEQAGPDATWGRVRPVRLEHLLAKSAPMLAPIFNRGPVPIGGDNNTIPQASVVVHDPFASPLGFPNMRMAVPTGDWAAARWALAGGQSGDPGSPHYDDQVGPWQHSGIPIPWSPEDVEAATVGSLTLKAAG